MSELSTEDRSFTDIVAGHAGKTVDKWRSYLPTYEALFAKFRTRRIALLEIGIQNGGSLEVYAGYFRNAEIIVGCDIDPKCRLLKYPPGTEVVIGDCTDDDTRRRITAISPSFDVVIDDGSHASHDIISAFLGYFPLVRSGGVYVIEDLHASYWEKWQGGLFHDRSSIAFLKLLVDALHAEHWGVRQTIGDLVSLEFPEYRALFNEQAVRAIESISFTNSMCVIRKKEQGASGGLGTRIVRGAAAVVAPGIATLDGRSLVIPDERQNPASDFARRANGTAAALPAERDLPQKKPTIAAVMPVYNGERYLREAIRSVLDQTLFPHEFIIVDDGSTDGSRAIIEDMCRDYPITFLSMDRNSGQSAARNFAVSQCRSDLIALIDQDDRWYPNHLEKLVQPFEEHCHGLPLGWVYSDFDDIDENGLLMSRSFIDRPMVQNPKRDLIRFLVEGALTQPSATLISRTAFEAIGGFDESLSGFEDEDLFLRMFRANYDNVYIADPLSQWRIYSTSSGASSRMAASQRYFFRKLIALFPDDKWRGHYYVRDCIAPRFVRIWVGMYLRAGRFRNFEVMREYAWDIWNLLPRLRLRPRIMLALAMPVLLWPRVGEIALKAGSRWARLTGL